MLLLYFTPSSTHCWHIPLQHNTSNTFHSLQHTLLAHSPPAQCFYYISLPPAHTAGTFPSSTMLLLYFTPSSTHCWHILLQHNTSNTFHSLQHTLLAHSPPVQCFYYISLPPAHTAGTFPSSTTLLIHFTPSSTHCWHIPLQHNASFIFHTLQHTLLAHSPLLHITPIQRTSSLLHYTPSSTQCWHILQYLTMGRADAWAALSQVITLI